MFFSIKLSFILCIFNNLNLKILLSSPSVKLEVYNLIENQDFFLNLSTPNQLVFYQSKGSQM